MQLVEDGPPGRCDEGLEDVAHAGMIRKSWLAYQALDEKSLDDQRHVPELLLRLGVTMVESNASGKTDPDGRGPEQRLMSPWGFNAFEKSAALCRITQRLMWQCGVTPLMNQRGEW
jgi:hypothetical protein